MNAESEQQQQQQQQQQNDAPQYQLWQSSSLRHKLAATVADVAASAKINKNGDNSNNYGDSSARGTGNNNYVNFNQFLMQHNLAANANDFAMNGGGNAYNQFMAQHSAYNPNPYAAGGGGDGLNEMSSAHLAMSQNAPFHNNYHNSGNMNNGFYSTNPFNPNFNQFYQTNGFSPVNDITTAASNSHLSNRNANGYALNMIAPNTNVPTTYFSNPFATGFDINCSKLQVSAQEFVPRFGSLSLSEDKPTEMNEIKDLNKQANADAIANANAEGAASLFSNEQPKQLDTTTALFAVNMNERADNGNETVYATNRNKPFAGQKNERRLSATGKSAAEKYDKQAAARAERDRERDSRRFQNGQRTVELPMAQREQLPPYERQERVERAERSNYRNNRDRDRDREHQQRFDNHHRSNKRRDDWNRNRDRINGFRVDDSPLASPDKKKSPQKNGAENEKLSQREKLMQDIEIRRLECLVCVESIKSHHAIWSCSNCYLILHLQCITKWASSSKAENGWRCPACQNVVKQVPHDYYCFCGKLKNPPFNRQDIAHSCGELCGRIEGCAHACTLLCHPGPCPPCQATVNRTCGCGKTNKMMQCCQKETIECSFDCGKLLNCELHICKAKCHDGKCAACEEKVEQICHCGKNEREVACTRDSHEKHNYSCGKPCGKDLTCGNHKCKDCCHAGDCRPCKLSPEVVNTCPCGKMQIEAEQRSSCLDPIPVCGGVCYKTLRCGKPANPHHCTSQCHLGNCPPCNKNTAVKCRCGHMDQQIKCRQLSTRADDARCKKRCVKKRSCGKHKCNQECCIDIDHICPLPCNYTLSCGKHKCDQPCHRGNCPPCYRSSFDELYCECGAEVIYPPVPCGTKRPVCTRPCIRTHPCEHPPQHNCHSGPSCPPCVMFTTKWCFGKHQQRKTIPCSQESYSCGLPCNKSLKCGRHKCIKPCHEGDCQTATDVCKQSCAKLRANCGHKCAATCHDGECPDIPCKEMIEVQCECGNRKQMRSCHDLTHEFSRIVTAHLASSMAEMQRGNQLELSDILMPVKANKTNKTLDCNEECRLVERNRRLAVGLQVRNPDLPQKLHTKYSDFVRNFAKKDPALVKSIYESLTQLVKLAKESKQKSRSHSFPTMNREKRQLVHELCEMFGVESVAYDAEPNRNVVATAKRDSSWLPATSIMEVMQRESGQRRIPVPNNNAWGTKR